MSRALKTRRHAHTDYWATNTFFGNSLAASGRNRAGLFGQTPPPAVWLLAGGNVQVHGSDSNMHIRNYKINILRTTPQ